MGLGLGMTGGPEELVIDEEVQTLTPERGISRLLIGIFHRPAQNLYWVTWTMRLDTEYNG